MKKISIDETKLPAVMEIIEKAALLMDEKDCDSDKLDFIGGGIKALRAVVSKSV